MSEKTESRSELAWRVHPARERAGRALIGSLIILAVSALAGVMMQSVWWSLFSAFILVGFLNRFFFPTRFEIDEDGITAAYPLGQKRLLWTELRRFVHDDAGGLLSTRARRSWLDAHRGMHVLFGRDANRVIAAIRAHLPEGAGSWAC